MSELWGRTIDLLKKSIRERPPQRLRRDAELDHLQSLPEVPYEPDGPAGVLLSDHIERYAVRWRMIEPYNPKKLKPAAYELSVGELYSIGGQTGKLSPETGKNEIIIKPFEVVIIQTLERLNLPRFLIARWNLRVKWAYKGLLWVGGPQVDPGYQGYLFCPLYNLSDTDVRLSYGEEIAVIDFVTTTPLTSQPIEDRYKGSRRILFEDYEPELLQSALATRTERKLQAVETELKELRANVSTSVAIIFAAIGIIVSALALFVSRDVPEPFAYYSPTLLVSAFAVAVSFMMWGHTVYRHIRYDKPRKFRILVLELIGLILLALIAVELYLFRAVPGRFLH
jgi:deoxycytidine triphosphate deaminase